VDDRFICPRCGSPATARFYGPCSPCRERLRAAYGGEQRAEAEVVFEPKMNVTPNQIASKD
jgi:hypothetical protein